MPEHDRPNAERLRMIMDTNQVSAAEVARLLAVPEATVDDWLTPSQRGGTQDIPDEALKQLRMKLSVNR